MKTGFIEKLVERLDRVDPRSLEAYLLQLVQEKGLLETIFQSIQEGVIVIDEAGRLTYANRAAEHLLGFSLESVGKRPLSRYLGDLEWDRLFDVHSAGESRLLSREIEITYPAHRFVSFYVVALPPVPRHEKGAVVILRDVTRDRKEEESLVESERLNAVKLLAAGVAHEIGNPLNALNIHLQLLDRDIRGLSGQAEGGARAGAKDLAQSLDGLHELVGVARSEVARLDLIINQFLRALRPSRPKLVPTRIENVLKETLALLKHEIEDRNTRVEIDAPASLPRVPADRDQIKQAFFNVIRNGLQAMPDGGRLRIGLACTDQYLEIAFADSGVGIKSEDLSRIFDPYYTTKPAGSGLGLMIVQRIVQDHGGQIDVASKPGAGTRFTMLLPLAERRVRLLRAAPSGAARGAAAGGDES